VPITVPTHVIDAQLHADAAFAAITLHQETVGRPALEWSDEETARLIELWKEATAAAEALHTAVAQSGLVQEHGMFEAQAAVKAAAREAASR
jgi:hypothetical protein